MHKNKIKNMASNYCYKYGLNETGHLKELELLVAQHYPKQYLIFICICQIAVNSRLENFTKWFIVEINNEQNEPLLIDLGHRFFTDVLLSWRETEKIGHGYKQSSLNKIIRVHK